MSTVPHHSDESSLTTPTSSAFAGGSVDTLMTPLNAVSDSQGSKQSGYHRSATPPLLRTPAGIAFANQVRQWGQSEIASFLNLYKCEQYVALFQQNDIDGKVLLDLDMSSLKEIGITKIGDRVKLLGGVRDLRKRAARVIPVLPRTLPIAVDSSDNYAASPSEQEARGSQVQKRLAATTLVSKRLQSSRPPPLNLHRPNPSPAAEGLSFDKAGGSPTSRSVTPKSLQPQSLPKSLHMTSVQDVVVNQGTSSYEPSTLRPPFSRDARRSPSPANDYSSTFPSKPLLASDEATWRATPRPDVPSGVKVADRRQAISRYPDTKLTSPNQHTGLRDGSPGPPHPFAATMGRQDSSLAAHSESLRRTVPRSYSGHSMSGGATNNLDATPRQPTLEHLLRQVVKFVNFEDGTTKTVNVSSCTSGVDVLETVLKKFGKWNTGSLTNLSSDGDGDNDHLEVDGWSVFVKGDPGEDDRPLSEAALLDICHHRTPRSASHHDPAVLRERGLILRRVSNSINRKNMDIFLGREFPPAPLSPNSPSHFVGVPRLGTQTEHNWSQELATTKASNKNRASTVSILSGLGVPGAIDPSPSSNSTRSPSSGTATSRTKRMYNFFGHRPPSELISNHLSEYFPAARKRDLEKTVRQSMLRLSLGQGDRQMIGPHTLTDLEPASPFSASLESVASPSRRGRPPSTRTVSSSTTPAAIPEEVETSPETPARGQPGEEINAAVGNHPPLLPPFESTGTSLVDSLQEYSPAPSAVRSGLRSGRRGSGGSTLSRISVLSTIRHSKDKSDSASLLTVDEITADVENRRTSMANAEDLVQQHLLSPAESDADSTDSESESDDYDSEDSRDDDGKEQNRAFTSTGSKRNIKWIKGALIGAGSFGSVFLGMDAQSGLLMAVKQVELPSGDARNEERKKNMVQALEREIALLKELQHPNIVQYLDSASDGNNLYIFLEYVPGGSVAALLSNYGAFEELLVRNFVRQILTGLNYLHEREIIHRDIKGANILVDNKGGIKISDFGISKKAETSLISGMRANRPSLQGSVFWMAPEVVKQTSYTSKADIWSVGCLVVEMVTGTHPWADLSQMQAIFRLGSSARPDTPSDISAEAADFLQRTFEINHNARPTAAALLEHAFIIADRSPSQAAISLEQANATLNSVAASRTQGIGPLTGLGIGLTMKD